MKFWWDIIISLVLLNMVRHLNG